MNKQELRKSLLEEMSYCAEIISQVLDIHFDNSERPEAFKAGVADKFMFNKIIDRVIDNVHSELNGKEVTNFGMKGIQIMAIYYYPYYGTWKKIFREDIYRAWKNGLPQ